MKIMAQGFYQVALLAAILLVYQAPAVAETVSAYQLDYEEQEPGIDPYPTRYLVTDRFLRIDENSDGDGFVLYDDSSKTIYSVSHFDHSTLVMKYSDYIQIDLAQIVETSYQEMKDAPQISGHPVYQYRVSARADEKEVCTSIMLAQDLLPDVTRILRNYTLVLAASQVNNLRKTPKEFQTTCYIADQIYNTGEYYNKGLPIQEWHSNEKKKALVNYKKLDVDVKEFVLPENYRHFTLGDI